MKTAPDPNPAGAGPGAAAAAPGKIGPGEGSPAVPDPNEVVPDGTDPALVAALAIVEERQRAVASIRQKIALAETALTEAVAREERAEFLAEFAAEFAGSDEIAQTAETRKLRVAAEEALQRLKMALKGAQTALAEARGDHFRLNVELSRRAFKGSVRPVQSPQPRCKLPLKSMAPRLNNSSGTAPSSPGPMWRPN
ncbi:MAG: hypothetical protein L0Z50_40555 [Verrucomicrobiales bacterium]|nr:hypothetical protein [Verrucomicrobiales bacterium]